LQSAARSSKSISGILIVLGRKPTLDLLIELLRYQPLPTFGAASSGEARRLLDLFIPNMFVIDLDLENSSLLLRDVRQTHPQVDVIAVTDSDERANLYRRQGISKVLTSPGKESFIDSLMFLLGVEHEPPAGPRVLLAMGDREEQVTLTAFLIRNGYDIRTAETRAEARKILMADPSIRLLLLDLMFEEKGLALLREVSEQFPQTGVIMLSALHDQEVARMAARIGAIDYIVRPIKPPELVDAMETAISRLDYRGKPSWWKRLLH
jgi:DNA-binding response OmpR family regulator